MQLHVKLLPGWADVSAKNPKGPPTYIRSLSTKSGAFQVSWAEYKGGKVPNPTVEILQGMSEDFGLKRQLGKMVTSYHGKCDYGIFGTAVFRSEKCAYFQLWTISDGRNFIRATHISIKEPEPIETAEAEQIAKMLTLKADAKASS